ncbi:MAG TPA: MFS transporter [Bacilli bacterium]|nr:MFS transporter [Bacilli bacterium]
MNLFKTYKGDNVPRLTKYVFSFTGIGRDAAYTLINLFLMIYLQLTMPVGNADYKAMITVIMVFMLIFHLWDGFNDPLIGTIIENARLKLGKFKPWILYGGIINGLLLMVLFSWRPFTGWAYVVFFLVVYLLWEISFTFNDIGYWGMVPSLTRDPKQRNQITMLMAIAVNIGAFAVGGLVPSLYPGRAVSMFRLLSIIIGSIYILSQVLLVFLCQERDRSEIDQEEIIKVRDIFKIIKDNKPLLIMMVAIIFHYLAGAMFNNVGQNYMHYVFGYSEAGSAFFYFLIAYAAGSIIANFIFGGVSKKYSRAQILRTSYIINVIGNGLLVVIGSLHALGILAIPNHIYQWILPVIALIIFTPSGVFYLVLLVQITNTVEYNEWTTGDRKEGVVFAARPFAAKISNAMTVVIVFLTLTVGGIYDISNQISEFEVLGALSETEAGYLTAAEVLTNAQAAIDGANLMQARLVLVLAMGLLPALCSTAAYLFVKRKYPIDEAMYDQMIVEIDERKVEA